MALGDVVAGTFGVLKSKLGLFVLLALLPTALAVVAMLALAMSFVGVMIASLGSLSGSSEPPVGTLIGFGFAAVALVVVISLVQYKVMGMMSLATTDIANGGSPTVSDLWQRTKGLLPRVVTVLLAAIGLGAVAGVVLVLVFATVIGLSDQSDAAPVAIVLVLGLYLVLLVGGYALMVKLIYFLPALANESVSGFAALKRSWELTRGNFWRTLGYLIIAGLLVYAASFGANMISSLLFNTDPYISTNSSTSEQITAMLRAMAPAMVAMGALSGVVQLFSMPFLVIYTTVMYLDQIARNNAPQSYPEPMGYVNGGYAPSQLPYGYGQGGYGQQQGGGYPGQGVQPQPPQPPQTPGWNDEPGNGQHGTDGQGWR